MRDEELESKEPLRSPAFWAGYHGRSTFSRDFREGLDVLLGRVEGTRHEIQKCLDEVARRLDGLTERITALEAAKKDLE